MRRTQIASPGLILFSARATGFTVILCWLINMSIAGPAQAARDPFNGYRIYLSPSSQTTNIGCDGYNEAQESYALAQAIAYDNSSGNGLYQRGYDVKIGARNSTVNQRINESNAYGPRYHIAVHSNADNNPASCGAVNGGTQTYNYYCNVSGSYLAEQILTNLAPLSPGTDDKRIPRTDFAELNATTATSVYLEAAFHDYQPDKNWLLTRSNWSWRIGYAVDVRLGYP